MGSWRRRLEARVVSAVQRHLGTELVTNLDDADDRDVRAVARLYQVLDREPVYVAALRHIVSTLDQHYARPTLKPLTACLISSLLRETGQAFRSRRYTEEAQECDRLAAALAPGGPNRVVFQLLSAVSQEQRLHLLTPLTVDAILRALLYATSQTSGRVRRAGILISVAHAAHTTGNIDRLGGAAEALTRAATSAGATAVAAYYRSRHLIATGQLEEGFVAEAEFRRKAVEVPTWDKDHAHVAMLQATFENTSSATARAAEATRAGDFAQAAVWYGRSAEEMPAGPFRSTMRVLSEAARVRGDLLSSAESVRASVARLCADDAFAARSMVDVELLLSGLLQRTVDLYEAAGGTRAAEAMLAAETADLLGEVRGGAAVGHPKQKDAYRNDALADLTLLRLLSHTPRPVAPAAIAQRFPEYHVIWINLTGTTVDGHLLTIVTLRPHQPIPLVRRTPVSKADGKALAQCLDEESEDAPPEAVERIRGLFFADLDPAVPTPRILVVPDAVTWAMPWNELAPPSALEVALTRSAGAAIRSRPVSRGSRPRVVGIFDEQGLLGSRLEAQALEELSRQGHIHFTRVSSLAELESALAASSYDVLTISVHGTADDGFEYRLLLPSGPSSPAALLHLALPPTVVLGCCWSAKSTDRPDTTAAALSCLAAGASQVIGGLWAIDDELAGQLLTQTYDGYLRRGLSLSRALRVAHLALPREDRPAAAGLAFIGHA
ncbi:CHAT domain-containing protein [Streptomyces sp. NPDC050698]